LAIVVSAYYVPENIGRVVEIVRVAVRDVDYKSVIDGAAWIVRANSPLERVGGFGGFRLPPDCEAVCADVNLRPITPPGLTEEVTEEIEVTA
jgi:hypothetical protein